MSELPDDLAIETVWIIEGTYAPDAARTRVPFRAQHLARLAALEDAGVIIEAGAYTDMSTSLLIVRAADEAAALDIVRGDSYLANGVWVEVRARPFGRLVRAAAAGG